MAELSAQGPSLHSGATSVIDSAQMVKLGSRGIDTDGNEYVYVDFQQALAIGEWVSFDHNYAATRITAASRGFVGIVVGTVSASDRFGYVQVRGVNTFAWASSGATTADPIVIAATTDLGAVGTGTSADTSVAVFNAKVCTAPDTCASTALSTSALAAPCTVILMYPFITGQFNVSS